MSFTLGGTRPASLYVCKKKYQTMLEGTVCCFNDSPPDMTNAEKKTLEDHWVKIDLNSTILKAVFDRLAHLEAEAVKLKQEVIKNVR